MPNASDPPKDTKPPTSLGTFALASAFLGHLRRFSHTADERKPELEPDSVFEPPPLSPLVLDGYSPKTKTRLLAPGLAEQVRGLLPARNQLYDSWTLVYSLEQHGASLTTLYNNSAPHARHTGSEERTASKHGYVLVVCDTAHNLFGAYVNEHFHPSTVQASRRFYGNGDCFLWTSRRGSAEDSNDIQFQGFPYTGVNDFVIYCTNQFLSLGGGDGHYGLWIDDSLAHGVSSHSLTFGNDPLSSLGTNFDIIGVEVWKIG